MIHSAITNHTKYLLLFLWRAERMHERNETASDCIFLVYLRQSLGRHIRFGLHWKMHPYRTASNHVKCNKSVRAVCVRLCDGDFVFHLFFSEIITVHVGSVLTLDHRVQLYLRRNAYALVEPKVCFMNDSFID